MKDKEFVIEQKLRDIYYDPSTHGGRLLCNLLPEARAHISQRLLPVPSKICNNKMAASSKDLAECLSNLKLGSSGEDTERSKRFWNASTIELKFGMEKFWLDAVWKCGEKPNLGMRNLDAILEERAGFKLELVGPMIDSYLGEIGKGMAGKLGRSRCTGLMPPLRLFVPYFIFRHLCNIIVGYGG